MAGARVLVTGAGRGLGRRLVLRAAARGAQVVLWDVDLERAEAVRDDHQHAEHVRDLVAHGVGELGGVALVA